MKLVIEIPEDVYTRLFDNGIQDNEIAVDDVCEIARVLRLGTPFPNIINTLDEMDLADYDYHTIQIIKQILNGNETTH